MGKGKFMKTIRLDQERNVAMVMMMMMMMKCHQGLRSFQCLQQGETTGTRYVWLHGIWSANMQQVTSITSRR